MAPSVWCGDPVEMWAGLRPDEVAALLEGLRVPWWLAGGWAVDAAVGRPTRPHGDTDVAVLRRDAAALRRHLAGWDVRLADPPGTLRPWAAGEPVAGHTAWCRPAPGEPWAVQVLFEDSDGADWVYRRDPRVRRPLRDLGERVLAPEVQLLYKSTAPRPVDEADLAALLPVLDAEQREWLAGALRLTAPAHPWLARL